ncbi:MAG TPA: hypothetical protein VMF58_12930 [Rhizomicrobium sp.]|nr:hypothetical protein [Rhizomicrobium sp.]
MIKFKAILLAGVAGAGLLTTVAHAQSGPTNIQPPLTSQSDSGTHSLTGSSSGQSTPSTPPIPNSDSNYLDDTLEWNMPVYIYPTGNKGVDLSSTFCLPANTPVIGLDSKYTTGTPPNSTTAQNYLPLRLGDSVLKNVDMVLLTKAQSQSSPASTQGAARCDHISNAAVAVDKANPPKLTNDEYPIFTDTQFYVSANDLDHTATRAGWDFGTLVVPFKFQMSDKSIVTGSATLGGYVGYNFGLDMPGFRVSPVVFVGVSDISMTNSGGTGGKSTTDTVAGMSYGIGLMGTIKDSFNISLVFGADHASSKSYQYQDKPWVSFALGYSFTK